MHWYSAARLLVCCSAQVAIYSVMLRELVDAAHVHRIAAVLAAVVAVLGGNCRRIWTGGSLAVIIRRLLLSRLICGPIV